LDPHPASNWLPRLIFINRYFDPDESATSQMLTDLARGLCTRGFEVHVVCSRQLYADSSAQLKAREHRSGVFVRRVATTRFGRARLFGRALDYTSFYVSAALALIEVARRKDFLIAKTDPPLIGVLAAVIAHLKGSRLINWQQDVFPEVASQLGVSPLPLWLDALLRKLRDSSLRSAKMNVVIGSRMLQYFENRGIPTSKLRVIENWADAAIEPKPTERSAFRAQLGISNQFVVCYSGNLGRAHEFETLLAAAQELREVRSIVFLMVGGGARMESLRQAVRSQSLDSFIFSPYQERSTLEDSLAAADVHLASLLPSLEGFIVPSKVYGILAAGRPLIFIGDADGDVGRTLNEAQCGISVSVDNGIQLAASIVHLQSDPAACSAMGARAREVFLSRYAFAHAIDKWISVFSA
jgi:colanic acid biosynthesis glycosyl transferase WcaI